MKRLVLLAAAAVCPLRAHVMSMSTGDVAVEGNRAHYELHMPIYEIADVKNPETALFAHIRFSTALEAAVTQTGAGFMRAVGGLVQILFLATLALAARSRRELAALAGMFLLGQIATAVIAPKTSWEPAPRFVEAATALTIAYMAVEILALPEAGKRWLIAGALGVFHGLYFALFLRTTGYSAVYVLAGAGVAEVLLIALFGFVFSKVGRLAAGMRPVQVSAGLLLGIGMFWFFLRLRG